MTDTLQIGGARNLAQHVMQRTEIATLTGAPGRATPSAPPARRRRRLVRHELAGLILLAVVAACGGQSGPPTTVALSDSADHIAIRVSNFLTVDGVLRAHIIADTAFVFDGTQEAELRGVLVRFYTSTGEQTSVLTSKQGHYNFRTQDMIARGSVVIRGVDGRRLTTEELRYSRATDEITSDYPFVFDAPGRHLEGDGFTADPEFSNIVTRGAHGPAGRVDLPNQ